MCVHKSVKLIFPDLLTVYSGACCHHCVDVVADSGVTSCVRKLCQIYLFGALIVTELLK